MRRLSLLAIALLLFSWAIAQDLAPEVRANLEQRVKIQRAFAGRLNSPGAELHAGEVGRGRVRVGVSAVTYELRTKGLPADLDYDLLVLPPDASDGNQLLSGGGSVRINEHDGRVMDGPNDPRFIVLPDFLPGEPARFVLVSKNGKYRASVLIFPNPIQATDKGCEVTVVRLYRNFEAALIQASGSPPGTEIAVRGDSEGEVHEFKIRVNTEGYGDLAVLPAKLGKSKGTMVLQFNSPNCTPTLKFRWGKTENGQPYQ